MLVMKLRQQYLQYILIIATSLESPYRGFTKYQARYKHFYYFYCMGLESDL